MEIVQLIEKAIGYALHDAYYLLPVIGSIQIFLTGLFLRRAKLIYLSFFLFLLFSSIFPLVKLIPNLGSDAFSEFQKLNFDEVVFYIRLSIFLQVGQKNILFYGF